MSDALYIKKSKILRSSDILLIVIIIVMIVLSFALAFQKDEGNTVEVYLEGELLYRIPLNADRIIELDEIGYIIIENSTVRVQDINCPDKLCEHQGTVSKAGQSIICLPNKLIVLVTGESDWDVIV